MTIPSKVGEAGCSQLAPKWVGGFLEGQCHIRNSVLVSVADRLDIQL